MIVPKMHHKFSLYLESYSAEALVKNLAMPSNFQRQSRIHDRNWVIWIIFSWNYLKLFRSIGLAKTGWLLVANQPCLARYAEPIQFLINFNGPPRNCSWGQHQC